jgi:hypothetical protein
MNFNWHAETPHKGPDPVTVPGTGTFRWDLIPDSKVSILSSAISLILMRTVSDNAVLATCNTAFKNLPRKVSFADVLGDADVWISYCANDLGTVLGATLRKEITICERAFTRPQAEKVVAATIIHELAHVAGAPGGLSKTAEATLQQCGFSDQWDSTVQGAAERAGRGYGRA